MSARIACRYTQVATLLIVCQFAVPAAADVSLLDTTLLPELAVLDISAPVPPPSDAFHADTSERLNRIRPTTRHDEYQLTGYETVSLQAHALIAVVDAVELGAAEPGDFDRWHTMDVDVADHQSFFTRPDAGETEHLSVGGLELVRRWQYSAQRGIMHVDFQLTRRGDAVIDAEYPPSYEPLRELLTLQVGAAPVVVATAD